MADGAFLSSAAAPAAKANDAPPPLVFRSAVWVSPSSDSSPPYLAVDYCCCRGPAAGSSSGRELTAIWRRTPEPNPRARGGTTAIALGGGRR